MAGDSAGQESGPMTALEFYSGIGGLHCAFAASSARGRVVGAFDINTAANEVYRHNFPDTKVHQRNIESITAAELGKQNASVYLMSPPCQPYTRQGKQQGSSDARSRSFLHILDLFPQLENKPQYMLIENVKGFEVSDTRAVLVDQLSRLGYDYREFLLTPSQLSVPNSRLRYFLLAKLAPLAFVGGRRDDVMVTIPGDPMCHPAPEFGRRPEKGAAAEPQEPGSEQTQDPGVGVESEASVSHCRPIGEYLDEGRGDWTPYMVPRKVLLTKGVLFDILVPSDRRSCCFTKAYTHFVEGTGSVLQTNRERRYQDAFQRLVDCKAKNKKPRLEDGADAVLGPSPSDVEEAENDVTALGIRYLTETEIARLHCMPETFTFPARTSTKSAYKLLGNSLNVKVVTHLLNFMFREPA